MTARRRPRRGSSSARSRIRWPSAAVRRQTVRGRQPSTDSAAVVIATTSSSSIPAAHRSVIPKRARSASALSRAALIGPVPRSRRRRSPLPRSRRLRSRSAGRLRPARRNTSCSGASTTYRSLLSSRCRQPATPISPFRPERRISTACVPSAARHGATSITPRRSRSRKIL